MGDFVGMTNVFVDQEYDIEAICKYVYMFCVFYDVYGK